MNIVQKKKWERLGLYGLMFLIGLAFVAMFLAIFDPRTGYTPPPATGSTENETVSRHGFGTPRQAMNVHRSGDAEVMRSETGGVLSARRVLIPKLPESGGPNLLGNAPLPLPAAVQRGGRRDDEQEDDRIETGWGWLADDIMSKRRDQEVALDQIDEEENQNDQREHPLSIFTAGDGEREQAHFFINPAFQREQDDDSTDRAGVRDAGVDWQRASTREQTGSAEENQRDVYEQPGVNHTPGSMEIRDPFAAQERLQASLTDPGRNQGSGDDPFARFTDASASFGQSRAEEWTRVRADESAMRIISDARNDASRITSPWTGYASDSIFNAGGGYTPSGIGSGGSDPVFSGAGVFGGESIFSVSSPSASMSGGMPIGGGIGITTPSGSGSLGSSRQDSDLPATPRALPW